MSEGIRRDRGREGVREREEGQDYIQGGEGRESRQRERGERESERE